MAVLVTQRRELVISVMQQWLRDAELGINNLLLHRTRSLLTMTRPLPLPRATFSCSSRSPAAPAARSSAGSAPWRFTSRGRAS